VQRPHEASAARGRPPPPLCPRGQAERGEQRLCQNRSSSPSPGRQGHQSVCHRWTTHVNVTACLVHPHTGQKKHHRRVWTTWAWIFDVVVHPLASPAPCVGAMLVSPGHLLSAQTACDPPGLPARLYPGRMAVNQHPALVPQTPLSHRGAARWPEPGQPGARAPGGGRLMSAELQPATCRHRPVHNRGCVQCEVAELRLRLGLPWMPADASRRGRRSVRPVRRTRPRAAAPPAGPPADSQHPHGQPAPLPPLTAGSTVGECLPGEPCRCSP
jgi:hypothetical protein